MQPNLDSKAPLPRCAAHPARRSVRGTPTCVSDSWFSMKATGSNMASATFSTAFCDRDKKDECQRGSVTGAGSQQGASVRQQARALPPRGIGSTQRHALGTSQRPAPNHLQRAPGRGEDGGRRRASDGAAHALACGLLRQRAVLSKGQEAQAQGDGARLALRAPVVRVSPGGQTLSDRAQRLCGLAATSVTPTLMCVAAAAASPQRQLHVLRLPIHQVLQKKCNVSVHRAQV